MGVTVVVVSNDDRNDVADIALHVAVLMVGQRLGLPHPTAAPVIVPATKAVQATVKLPSGSVLPMVTAGALWASLVDSGKLVRVDTTTGKVASVVTVTRQPGVVNGDGPFGVVSWHGQVWTTDDSHNAVARIDPATGRVVEKVVVGVQAGELAVAGDSLWIATGDVPIRAVVRVDLRTKKVVATLHDAGAPYGILATTSAVWVSDHDTAQVLRIDPATNRVVARIAAGTNPQELALGAGALWVANGFGHYLTRIDPITNQVMATIALDRHGNGTDPWNWCACHSVLVADGAVWAIAHDKHALLRIDPRTNRVTSTLTLAVAADGTPMEPFNVVSGAGSLWVTADPQYLIRIDPRAMP
jgi:virginiamycin B lyase